MPCVPGLLAVQAPVQGGHCCLPFRVPAPGRRLLTAGKKQAMTPQRLFGKCCREKCLPPARQKRCLLALDVQQRLKGSSCFIMPMIT